MLERHVKSPKGSSLLSDEDHDNKSGSSSEITGGASSKENLQCTEDKRVQDVEVDEDAIGVSDHDDLVDNEVQEAQRKSVLEMANAIESSMTISPGEADVRKPSANTSDDADDSVNTPPDEPTSQFWSLQGGRRSSVANNLPKFKRQQPLPSPTPPKPEPQIFKTPVQEPKETVPRFLDTNAVSPVTSPAAIICSKLPSPNRSVSTSNRTVITRETLEGSGPRVRLTRAELLRQKAKEKKQREEMALKPRTNGFFNKSSRVHRQKDYPKPSRLVSDNNINNNKKKPTPTVRTSRTSRPQEPRMSTGKEPQINQLPGRRSRSKPAGMATKQTGKVRLTRAAILKLRQAQEKSANKMTLQDLDNQRLGIPPVKFLEIPNSPTKINFEDDEMEHPNDIARRKLRQLFDDNKAR